MSVLAFLLLILLTLIPNVMLAHPGRTNAQGCHNHPINSGYHCHTEDDQTSGVFKLESQHPPEEYKKSGHSLRLDYEGFTVWIDCSKRGAVKFRYNAHKDTGNFKRSKKFFLDTDVPSECQQTTGKAYGQGYDRGHLVPANHLDYSQTAIYNTNVMTNILPQSANMNRGAWLQTEEITECYRDIDELLVIGGVIWGQNTSDDYFIKSHGVRTPDAFWKIIIRGRSNDERVIAWVIPNREDAKRKMLDQYLVTVFEIERITGEQIPVADYVKHDKPQASWMIPAGCDKG